MQAFIIGSPQIKCQLLKYSILLSIWISNMFLGMLKSKFVLQNWYLLSSLELLKLNFDCWLILKIIDKHVITNEYSSILKPILFHLSQRALTERIYLTHCSRSESTHIHKNFIPTYYIFVWKLFQRAKWDEVYVCGIFFYVFLK